MVTAQPVKIPLSQKMAVGAVAGIIGTAAIFPIDVVKTRLQNQKPDRLGGCHGTATQRACRACTPRDVLCRSPEV